MKNLVLIAMIMFQAIIGTSQNSFSNHSAFRFNINSKNDSVTLAYQEVKIQENGKRSKNFPLLDKLILDNELNYASDYWDWPKTNNRERQSILGKIYFSKEPVSFGEFITHRYTNWYNKEEIRVNFCGKKQGKTIILYEEVNPTGKHSSMLFAWFIIFLVVLVILIITIRKQLINAKESRKPTMGFSDNGFPYAVLTSLAAFEAVFLTIGEGKSSAPLPFIIVIFFSSWYLIHKFVLLKIYKRELSSKDKI